MGSRAVVLETEKAQWGILIASPPMWPVTQCVGSVGKYMHFSCMMLCQDTWETFLSWFGALNISQTHTHTARLCVIVTTGFVNKQFEFPRLYFVTISILGVNLSRAE